MLLITLNKATCLCKSYESLIWHIVYYIHRYNIYSKRIVYRFNLERLKSLSACYFTLYSRKYMQNLGGTFSSYFYLMFIFESVFLVFVVEFFKMKQTNK